MITDHKSINSQTAIEKTETVQTDASTHGWPILIIDDDDSILQITRLVLSRVSVLGRPMKLSFATSSEQARALCRCMEFAVIVVDVVMETDRAGLDFVAWLRAQPFGRRPQVVIRTGQPGSIPEREVLSNAKINDYWSKTELSPKRLREQMTRLLEAYSAPDADL